MQAKLITVDKMQKILKLFPLMATVILLFQCSSGFRPIAPHRAYIDLDDDATVSIEENLKKEIKKFYGAPYKWGGSSPKGTDCSGMVKTIYKNAAGVVLPHNADMIFKSTQKISSRELHFGDLVFFSGNNGTKTTHMGMYIKSGYFVHASSSQGVILSKLDDVYYKRQFIGARRVK